MDTSTLFRVAPTFPMDDQHIRERRRILLMISPMTWSSLLGVSFLGVLAGFGVLGFAGLYAVTGLALRWYWDHHRSALDARALRDLVIESNHAQDVDLTRIIRRLGEKHFPQYAVCLGRFLFLKQKIEGHLHGDNGVGVFAVELEELLDGVCSEVCREMTRLIDSEKTLGEVLTSQSESRLEQLESLRRESHAAILHAYTTLYRTYAELVDLEQLPIEFSPVAREKESSSRLQGLVRDLKEETALISRANRRVKASYESVPAKTTYAGEVALES